MASALQSRTRTFLAQKPQILTSFFTERWFSIWASQYHSTVVTPDPAPVIIALRASFSAQSLSTNKPVAAEVEVQTPDTPRNIPDEKHDASQDNQSTSYRRQNVKDVFTLWGCSDEETSRIFQRVPSLHNAVPGKLRSKLETLHGLGFDPSDLVKIVTRRPRLLRCRINQNLDERIRFLESLFGSMEMTRKAVLRNPSLLVYDLHGTMIPVVDLYGSMGIAGADLVLMLLSRPTLIPRTSLTPEKLEYIRRTGVGRGSKMYKYVVTLVAISRIGTIREKVSNLERFGFTEEEVLRRLVGGSPLVLTLSVEKVQRNMTFVVGDMRLPPRAVLRHPFLLFCSLEAVLRPRMVVAGRIEEMGVGPRITGDRVFTALRMKEGRFLRAFVERHPPETAAALMGCYVEAKRVRRLAEESKTTVHKGFPF